MRCRRVRTVLFISSLPCQPCKIVRGGCVRNTHDMTATTVTNGKGTTLKAWASKTQKAQTTRDAATTTTFAFRPRPSYLLPFTVCNMYLHLRRCCRRRRPVRLDAFSTPFLFSTRLDVSSSPFVVVVVIVAVTKNTCYPRVTVRFGRPLTALQPFTFTVCVSSSTHVNTFLPSCDRPSGSSPNGGLTSCVFALSYVTIWLKAQGSRLAL